MKVTIPYICIDCRELFAAEPSPIRHSKRRIVCPKCRSIRTRMADFDEVVE